MNLRMKGVSRIIIILVSLGALINFVIMAVLYSRKTSDLQQQSPVSQTPTVIYTQKPDNSAVDREVDLNQTLDRKVDLNPTLDRKVDLNPTLDRKVDLNPTLDREVDLNPTLDRDVDLNPTLDRKVDLNPTLDRKVDINRTLDREVDLNPTHPKTNYVDGVIIKLEALRKGFFPTWFWKSTVDEIADITNAKRRKTGTPRSHSSSDNRPGSWDRLDRHIQQYFLYDPAHPSLRDVLHDMATLPFQKIDWGTEGGKAMKVNVKFQGGGWAVLKPMRLPQYNASRKNYERHYAEIAAFHADKVLGHYRVPPTTGRIVNITSEMSPLFPGPIKATVHIQDGRVCFYGVCEDACDKARSFCGNPDMIEVSLAYLVPGAASSNNPLILRMSPWNKYWAERVVDGWVSYEHVCNKTRLEVAKGNTLLLEIMDVRFFDIIIDNFDRHTYAMYDGFKNETVPVLFDNGRGFANPAEDSVFSTFERERSCCLIKKSTLLKYLKLERGPDSLSKLMRLSMSRDPVHPVLMEEYFVALDRRVKKLILYIIDCLKKYDLDEVIIDDVT